MGIRESLLNTITSVGNSDFVRIVTSAGASSKATVANVFKSFESGLGAKSNLGTSDYVRVVGSDNNSYKQSVANVATALGIDSCNFNASLTSLAAGTDLTTLNYGIYALNSNSYTNAPHTGNVVGRLIVRKSNDDSHYKILDYRSYDGTQYIGTYAWGGTFLRWEKTPTRAEIDALNSKSKQIASGNTAIMLSLSAYSVYMLVLLNDGGYPQYRNISFIATGANGGTVLPLAESTVVTTSLSGLSLTITRSAYVSGVLYKLT